MRKLLLCAVAAVMVPGAANAQAFVNGSFEQGPGVDDTTPVPNGGFLSVASGSTAITGWLVGGLGIDYIGSYWQAADGKRSIDLSGSAPGGGNAEGSISQVVNNLVMGQAYAVTFSLAGNPDGGGAVKVLVASGGGSQPDVFTFIQGGNTRSSMGWTTQTFTFIANATSANVVFSSAEENSFGPALDNVSIAAVPEPATWGMMIAGFGVVGGALRARRRKVAVTYA